MRLTKPLTLILAVLLGSSGCSCIAESVGIVRISLTHPPFVQLGYSDDPQWWDHSELALIRSRVDQYIMNNPSIGDDVKGDLRKLILRMGMRREQIRAILGEPTSVRRKGETEVWRYSGRHGYIAYWYYKYGELTFQKDSLRQITIPDPQYSCVM